MADVIGVISGVLTIFSFLQDNFPAADNPSSKMRVAVGLDGTQGLSNAGGDVPDIRLFNENLDFIGGAYDPGYITDGTHYDVTIDQSVAQQPTFALFTGNTDAVCIAYLSQTWPDDQKYGWVGNWGRQCGVNWYYSNIILNNQNLDCTWIDLNGDATDVSAFHVHFSEFTDKGKGYNTDVNYYCNNVRALNFQHNAGDTGTIYTRRNAADDSRLVKSTLPAHSAVDLCESETSSGPDFVSLAENMYCDMASREVLPLCAGQDGPCFDVDTLQKKTGLNSRDVSTKSFSQVLEWNGQQ